MKAGFTLEIEQGNCCKNGARVIQIIKMIETTRINKNINIRHIMWHNIYIY